MNQIKREIQKQKDKYAMLQQHKREEDAAFKEKFEQLVDIGQERSKIKETIAQIKFNSKADVEVAEGGEVVVKT